MQERKQYKDCSINSLAWNVSKILEYDFEYERYFQNARKIYSEISNIWLYWKNWIQNEKGKKSIIIKIDYLI